MKILLIACINREFLTFWKNERTVVFSVLEGHWAIYFSQYGFLGVLKDLG
jgi:hypothetical protein